MMCLHTLFQSIPVIHSKWWNKTPAQNRSQSSMEQRTQIKSHSAFRCATASVATGSSLLPERRQHLPQELAAAGWPLLHGNHVRPEGGDQKCRHVGRDATGLGGVRYSGVGEVQHRKGYCGPYQEGIWQEVQPHLALHCVVLTPHQCLIPCQIPPTKQEPSHSY